MREQITEMLSSSTGEGLGLTLGEARSVMRVGLMLAAACAAAIAPCSVSSSSSGTALPGSALTIVAGTDPADGAPDGRVDRLPWSRRRR